MVRVGDRRVGDRVRDRMVRVRVCDRMIRVKVGAPGGWRGFSVRSK